MGLHLHRSQRAQAVEEMAIQLLRILLAIVLAVYAVVVAVFFFGMVARLLYLAAKAFCKHGFKGFRPSYRGNTFNDVA